MAVTFLGLTIGSTPSGWEMPTANMWRLALSGYIATLRGKPNLQTNPGSLFGDMVDLVTIGVDIAGSAASEAVGRYIFTAMGGVPLDQFLADYLRRVVATPSTAVVYAYGSAGANVPAFTNIRTSPVSVAFLNTAPIVVASPSVAYAVEVDDFAAGAHAGQLFRVTFDGNDADYVANNLDTGRTVRDGLIAAVDALLQSQTAYFAGQSPTTGRHALVVREDGGGGVFALTVLGPGVDQILAFPASSSPATTSPVTGPNNAPAGSLRYGPPFANLQGYANVDDAVPGRTGETDSQFRARHQVAQRGLGGGSPDAIRAIETQPVDVGGGGATFVSVEYNPGDDVDLAGNVGHSVRVVIAQTDDGQAAADALWIAKAAGDNTNGTELYMVEDFVGDLQPQLIDRLTDLWIAADITVVVGPDWPNVGDPLTQLRQDVVDFIEALQASKGLAVRVGDLPIALFPNGLPRGVDAWTVRLGQSVVQGGPYAYNGIFPTVEPDAEAASIPVGLRQKPRAQFVDVTAVIV